MADKPVLATKPGEVRRQPPAVSLGAERIPHQRSRRAGCATSRKCSWASGLGPDSYAIIEQGRIGQILSTKPIERRAIIEEAAGVTKFKTKKRLSEAKLESSKLNLSRVNDIVVEVEKQLGSLKRQAAKARRVLGNSGPDARHRSPDARGQGARTRCRGRTRWQAARRADGVRKQARSRDPDAGRRAGSPATSASTNSTRRFARTRTF